MDGTLPTPSPAAVLALATVLVLPAAWRPASRPWALAFVATLALVVGLPLLPAVWPGPPLIGSRWNWSGSLLGLAGTLAVARLLVRAGATHWGAFGLTWAQRSGSLPAAFAVSAAALVAHAVTMAAWPAPAGASAPTVETWLYQATLPGVVEEIAFRGVLLALLDRAFAGRVGVFGAPVGWGGVVVSAVFVALHAAPADVLAPALLYLWLRARTGSLVMPIVVHNLWNVAVVAAMR